MRDGEKSHRDTLFPRAPLAPCSPLSTPAVLSAHPVRCTQHCRTAAPGLIPRRRAAPSCTRKGPSSGLWADAIGPKLTLRRALGVRRAAAIGRRVIQCTAGGGAGGEGLDPPHRPGRRARLPQLRPRSPRTLHGSAAGPALGEGRPIRPLCPRAAATRLQQRHAAGPIRASPAVRLSSPAWRPSTLRCYRCPNVPGVPARRTKRERARERTSKKGSGRERKGEREIEIAREGEKGVGGSRTPSKRWGAPAAACSTRRCAGEHRACHWSTPLYGYGDDE